MTDPATLQAALAAGRDWLRAARNADGSWGYRPGQQGRPEATVLAAAAGPESDWLARAWLSTADLGWAHFLLPAVAWERDPALCEASLAVIAAFRSEPVEGIEGFDATLPGWSWVAGTAAWIEPTVFAMLSLHRAGRLPARVEQGQRLVLDRQCADGGWNYGNPVVLGAQLASHLDATGWALLGLATPASAPASPARQDAVEQGLRYLDGALERPSTMGLSLAALACQAHGRDPLPFLERLAPRMPRPGDPGRADLCALGCAALRATLEGDHAFV